MLAITRTNLNADFFVQKMMFIEEVNEKEYSALFRILT